MATAIDQGTKQTNVESDKQTSNFVVNVLNVVFALLKSPFLRRRFVFYMIAGFAAITINFIIPRLMPGDPVQLMFARFQGKLDPLALDALKEQFGFVDGPLTEQYLLYLKSVFTLDFGPSIMGFPVNATTVIWTSLRWTLILAGIASLMSFTIGTLLGIVAAWRRGGWVDSTLLPIASILGAFPYFWVALLALYGLGFQLDIFPTSHAYDTAIKQNWTSPEYIVSVLKHMLLPLLTIVFTAMGGWMLGMRNNMIGVLSQDYVVLAEAKGLSDKRIMLLYAARNAILPNLTAFAMSFGFVIGGALLTEIVFSYPGMGYTLLGAVNARDYPVMQGIFLVITATVLLANFIADMSYVLLDPRAR